jgi:hypothetical protein
MILARQGFNSKKPTAGIFRRLEKNWLIFRAGKRRAILNPDSAVSPTSTIAPLREIFHPAVAQ